jgi:single-stranded-DNA-specific exonuclease
VAQLENVKNPELIEHIQRIGKTFLRENTIKTTPKTMIQKRWVIAEKPAEEKIKHLCQTINVSEPIACLLVQRGINNFEEAKSFFNPDLKELHSPFLMKDMEKAVQRLSSAIEKEEKILIYGDYDVDGTTAVALFFTFLHQITPHCDYYVPDRFTEGYGISTQGIDFAAEQGFSLIVSLDCGIKSPDKVLYAQSKGIDCIICDHHEPDMDNLPQAVAVLDAKRKDCSYPYKELSGCGVGFKLLAALCEVKNIPLQKLYELTDFLAVSICADIVPITGENRILTHFGIERLNNNPKAGLATLMDIAGLKKNEETEKFDVNVRSIVFGIAPRINAAGRLKHASAAVDLMLAKNQEDAIKLADALHLRNQERQSIDKSITEEALAMIQKYYADANSSVLFNPKWHKGVVGIVASRCIENYYRPTIVLTEHNGKITGSARSVDGFDLYAALCECDDLLDQWGGHTHAAGMTLSANNLDAFRKKFEEVVKKQIKAEQKIPPIYIDTVIDFHQINFKFFEVLKRFEPHGPNNMTPIFMTENVLDNGWGKAIGKDNAHLKLNLYQPESPQRLYFDAVGFGMSHLLPEIQSNKPFDVCYTIEENIYNGNRKLQLKLRDIRQK